MKKSFVATVVFAALISLLISCKDRNTVNPLENLPKDTGGEHTAMLFGTTASPYGYYIYTPSAYTTSGPKFPLLIFLHGAGETGNSSTDPTALDKILVHGPPKLIKNGTWAPKFPMVVASAQCHEGWWDPYKIKAFTEFLMAHYQVDTSRIYMTGLSMGGYGTWDQITIIGKPSHLTAVVPISGSGLLGDARTANAALFPIWAFHGEDDPVVTTDFDKAIWHAINELNPHVRAKLTMYPATGHDAWTKTYDGTGMGKGDAAYDPFNMDIYTWMLQFTK